MITLSTDSRNNMYSVFSKTLISHQQSYPVVHLHHIYYISTDTPTSSLSPFQSRPKGAPSKAGYVEHAENDRIATEQPNDLLRPGDNRQWVVS